MITRVNHTSFTVSNLEQAVAFYRDLLGMRVLNVADRSPEFSERITGVPGAHLKIAYLEGGGHKLELIQYLSPAGERLDVRTANIGSAHLAFEVDDLWAVYRALKAKGVRFASEPLEIPAGSNKGALAVYFRGPDGITTELIQPPK